MHSQLDYAFQCGMQCELQSKGATKTKWVTHLIVYCFAQEIEKTHEHRMKEFAAKRMADKSRE